MPMRKTLAYLIAGGKGERLRPLTRDRAKSAVPFGASYRVIDFALSNLFNSDIRRVLVAVQYESVSLVEHIEAGWVPKFGFGNEYVRTLPARTGEGRDWYKGTADAVYQNAGYIRRENPDVVLVFGGDHIYVMDVSQMVDFHLENRADLTISAVRVPKKTAAKNLGVLVVDKDMRVLDFQEKPEEPKPIPGNGDTCYASMGNYTFDPDILMNSLNESQRRQSKHDFGHNIIPLMLDRGDRVFAYDFNDNRVPGAFEYQRGYWRDIGTIDDFFEANMELVGNKPSINLGNRERPIYTHAEITSPASIQCRDTVDTLMAGGVTFRGGSAKEAIISYGARITDAEILKSLLLGYNTVGEGAVIVNSIIERGVDVPPRTIIGKDKEHDKRRGLTVSNGGITIVPRKYVFR